MVWPLVGFPDLCSLTAKALETGLGEPMGFSDRPLDPETWELSTASGINWCRPVPRTREAPLGSGPRRERFATTSASGGREIPHNRTPAVPGSRRAADKSCGEPEKFIEGPVSPRYLWDFSTTGLARCLAQVRRIALGHSGRGRLLKQQVEKSHRDNESFDRP